MIKYKKDTNNIVTLTLDMSGRSANVINHEIAKAFVPVIAHLKAEKEKGLLRGVILTSAKKSFLIGGDLEYLYQANDPEEIFRFADWAAFRTEPPTTSFFNIFPALCGGPGRWQGFAPTTALLWWLLPGLAW